MEVIIFESSNVGIAIVVLNLTHSTLQPILELTFVDVFEGINEHSTAIKSVAKVTKNKYSTYGTFQYTSAYLGSICPFLLIYCF